ncbi:MAG: SMC-Scp complex subunit ScpB [Patescibacteria group bacterium]
MTTKQLIESLLFISGRPMSESKLSEIVNKDAKEVRTAAEELMTEWNIPARGVHIIKTGTSYQMATNPALAYLVKDFVKAEQSGELSRPSLETLTIVAYRGPITKAELEQIRGVNCSLILRNLLIKGLVEAHEDQAKMAAVYTITFDLLKFLGVNRVEALPDYQKLNADENLRKLLEQKIEQSNDEPAPPAAEKTEEK